MSKDLPRRQQPKRSLQMNEGRALGPKSPLVNADIQSFLAICMTSWDTDYDKDERQAIIETLPINHRKLEKDELGCLTCPITAEFVASDTYLKRAVARLKRDIADGYYEKSWQDKAKKAMQERLEGKFDGYITRTIEDMFQALPGDETESVSSDGEYVKKAQRKQRSKKVKTEEQHT